MNADLEKLKTVAVALGTTEYAIWNAIERARTNDQMARFVADLKFSMPNVQPYVPRALEDKSFSDIADEFMYPYRLFWYDLTDAIVAQLKWIMIWFIRRRK